jgi:hypothetical protein
MKVPAMCTGVKTLSIKKNRSVSDPIKKNQIEVDKVVLPDAPCIPDLVKSTDKLEPRKALDISFIPNVIQNFEQKHAESSPSAPLTHKPSPHIPSAPSIDDLPPIPDKRKRSKSCHSISIIGARTIVKARVLYDYNGTNVEETTIREGQIVGVLKPDEGTGWTLISNDGYSGVVPSTYLETLNPIEDQKSQTTLCAVVLYSYQKNSDEEMSIAAGETVDVIQQGIMILI